MKQIITSTREEFSKVETIVAKPMTVQVTRAPNDKRSSENDNHGFSSI